MASPTTTFNFAGKTREELGKELLAEASKSPGGIDEQKALALVAAGADLDTSNDQDDTPLILSALHGHIALGLALIEAKANIHVREMFGYNALMLSASGGYTELFDALVKNEARILDENNEGETPYYVAAQQGEYAIVEKLIKLGVPLEGRTNAGDTARNAARNAAKEKHFDNVVKLIDDAIFARDEPLRQEAARKAHALAHIGDPFKNGTGVDVAAPEKAAFKKRAPKYNS